jgi:hypothetical protein
MRLQIYTCDADGCTAENRNGARGWFEFGRDIRPTDTFLTRYTNGPGFSDGATAMMLQGIYCSYACLEAGVSNWLSSVKPS